MRRVWAGAALLVVAILVLVNLLNAREAARLAVPRPCSELEMIQALRSKAQETTSITELRRWIAESFHLAERDITVFTGSTPLVDLDWTSNGIRYTVEGSSSDPFAFRNEIVRFDDRTPTYGHLLQCLDWGDPDYYAASWGFQAPTGKSYAFSIFYTGRGVLMMSGDHYFKSIVPEQPPPLESSLPVLVISMVYPEPIDSLYRDVHHGVGPAGAEQPKPWPGSWEKLEYEIRP